MKTSTSSRLENIASRQRSNRIRDILFAAMVAGLMVLQVASFDAARRNALSSDSRTDVATPAAELTAQGAADECAAGQIHVILDADGQPLC